MRVREATRVSLNHVETLINALNVNLVMITNATTQSQVLISNISKIIEFNTTEIIKDVELKFDQYVSTIHIILSNSTYYSQTNSSIGLTTKPVPKGYVPVILVMYVLYAIFMVFVLLQILTMIHSAYVRLRARNHGELPASTFSPGWMPLVSVIIPVKGESLDAISDAIKRLVALDYPRDKLEVIIASDDDEATFNSIKALVDKMGKTYGLRILAHRRNKAVGYKGGAINEAAKLASGDVLLILDVDTALPRDYLKVALSYLNQGYDVVGAPFLGLPKVPNGFSKSLMVLFNILSEIQIVGRILSRQRRGFYMIIGNNLLIRREFFNRINGLCKCKADDIDLALRIWLMGGRIGVINSRVFTEIPSTYGAFRSQTIRWATNDMWALKRYLTQIIKSSRRGFLDKVDALLWLTKYPAVYIGLLSIVTTIIMQIFNIIVPPLPLLILSIIVDLAGVVLVALIITVGKAMNYSNWDLFKSLVVGGLTMYALGFPLMVYIVKSLVGDLPWFYTPKASKALMVQRFLIERVVVLSLIVVGVTLFIMGHVLVALYVIINSALVMAGYRVGSLNLSGPSPIINPRIR